MNIIMISDQAEYIRDTIICFVSFLYLGYFIYSEIYKKLNRNRNYFNEQLVQLREELLTVNDDRFVLVNSRKELLKEIKKLKKKNKHLQLEAEAFNIDFSRVIMESIRNKELIHKELDLLN